MVPELTHVGRKLDAATIEQRLVDPTTVDPDGRNSRRFGGKISPEDIKLNRPGGWLEGNKFRVRSFEVQKGRRMPDARNHRHHRASRSQTQQSQAPYPTPTGSPTSNGLAGFAKILCSAVFVSGRQPEEAAKNSAYFFMPRGEDADVTFKIDRAQTTVTTTRGEVSRTAKLHGDQGCIIENLEKPGIHFKPVPVRTALPDATTQAWPMGDAPSDGTAPGRCRCSYARRPRRTPRFPTRPRSLRHFSSSKRGDRCRAICAGRDERHTARSWSMGKSLTATLFALLVKDGTYTIDQPAPVPAWRAPATRAGQSAIATCCR
jgi:hypothetical protein